MDAAEGQMRPCVVLWRRRRKFTNWSSDVMAHAWLDPPDRIICHELNTKTVPAVVLIFQWANADCGFAGHAISCISSLFGTHVGKS